MPPYSLTGRFAAGLALLALLGGSWAATEAQTPPAQSASAQSQGPILAPGEFLVPLKNNCAIVLNSAASAKPMSQADIDKIKQVYATWSWYGPCRFGVAHGEGWLGPEPLGPSQSGGAAYFYGHKLNGSELRNRLEIDGQVVTSVATTYIAATSNVTLTDLPALDSPLWYGPSRFDSSIAFSDGKTVTVIQAQNTLCGVFRDFRGCRSGDSLSKVYGIAVATSEILPANSKRKPKDSFKMMPCPDNFNPASCVSLWTSLLAPYRPLIEKTIADSKASDQALITQVTALYADVEKAIADAEARRIADLKAAQAKAAADKAVADAKAASDKAVAEAKAAAEKAAAEKAAADKAAAEKARAQAEFQASLRTLNAGQLFIKATELRDAGDTDLSRLALKSLLSRFPDSPIAAQAAQQLAALGSPGAAPASSGGAAPVAAGASPAAAPAPAAVNVASDVIEVRLTNRTTNTFDNKVVARIPVAKFDEVAARLKRCRDSNGQGSGCALKYGLFPYGYDVLVQPSYTLGKSGNDTVPNCQYSPAAFMGYPLRIMPAEEACAYHMQEAIHEYLETEVAALRAGEGFLSTVAVAPLPGTSTGDCKKDVAAYSEGAISLRGRKPANASLIQTEQLAMYLAANEYRVLTTSCKSDTKYKDRIHQVLHSAGETKNNCKAFATDPNLCVPKLPW